MAIARARSLRLFYITNFAALGVYLPYFNLFLEEVGLSGAQIGLVSALLPLSTLLVPAAGGALADRIGQRRPLVVLAGVLSLLCFALMLRARSFAAIAAVVGGFAALRAPALPLVEASAVELAARGGPSYGRLRAWGSIAFILAALGGGWLIGVRGERIVVPLVTVLLAANAAASLGMPRDAPAAAPRPGPGRLTRVLLAPRTLVFLSACALSQAAHGPYYVFYSIHLERVGYAAGAIGWLWGWAVTCEVVVMLQMGRVLARVPAPVVLAACLALAALRWGICAVSAAAPAMILAQALHAATYAAFHVAAVTWTHRLFGADLAASGQGIYGAATYGLGNVVGMVLSGWLADTLSVPLLFAGAAGLALGGACLLAVAARGRDPSRPDAGRADSWPDYNAPAEEHPVDPMTRP